VYEITVFVTTEGVLESSSPFGVEDLKISWRRLTVQEFTGNWKEDPGRSQAAVADEVCV
jgi:hypothetical protein